MHGVTCGAIDDWRVGDVFTIVDHHCPNIDEDEECDVRKLLKWQDEGKDVVWHRLRKAVEWMEGMRREWSRHDPLVVWLVEMLVDARMMESSVDPVDEEVGEQQEHWELDDVVPPARTLLGGVVDLAVTSNLKPKCGSCQNGHTGQRLQRLPYFHANLVLQILRMFEGLVIEDEVV